MDGKESIIARIISDANNRAELINKTAENKRNENIKEATDWANEYKNAQTEILNADCENLISRRITLANLDVKKEILSSKRKVLTATADKVLTNLLNLDKTEYLKLLNSLMSKYAEKGDVVQLPENSPVTKDDILLLDVVKTLGLKVDDAKGDFIGGVRLIGEICDKDLSFKSYVDFAIEKYQAEMCKELFKTE